MAALREDCHKTISRLKLKQFKFQYPTSKPEYQNTQADVQDEALARFAQRAPTPAGSFVKILQVQRPRPQALVCSQNTEPLPRQLPIASVPLYSTHTKTEAKNTQNTQGTTMFKTPGWAAINIKRRTATPSVSPPPVPSTSSSSGSHKELGLRDKDFIVREIVNKRERNGIAEYEVKWDDTIVIDNIIHREGIRRYVYCAERQWDVESAIKVDPERGDDERFVRVSVKWANTWHTEEELPKARVRIKEYEEKHQNVNLAASQSFSSTAESSRSGQLPSQSDSDSSISPVLNEDYRLVVLQLLQRKPRSQKSLISKLELDEASPKRRVRINPRRLDKDAISFNKLERLTATLAQACGEKREARCTRCRTELGHFGEETNDKNEFCDCVTFGDIGRGACMNCYFAGMSSECAYNLTYKAKMNGKATLEPKGRPVGSPKSPVQGERLSPRPPSRGHTDNSADSDYSDSSDESDSDSDGDDLDVDTTKPSEPSHTGPASSGTSSPTPRSADGPGIRSSVDRASPSIQSPTPPSSASSGSQLKRINKRRRDSIGDDDLSDSNKRVASNGTVKLSARAAGKQPLYKVRHDRTVEEAGSPTPGPSNHRRTDSDDQDDDLSKLIDSEFIPLHAKSKPFTKGEATQEQVEFIQSMTNDSGRKTLEASWQAYEEYCREEGKKFTKCDFWFYISKYDWEGLNTAMEMIDADLKPGGRHQPIALE